MATFGGSSDHLYSRRGDLEGPIGSRMMLRGPNLGGRGREGSRRVSGGMGWFDESSDNSGGIFTYVQWIKTLFAGGWTDGRVNQRYYKRSLRT